MKGTRSGHEPVSLKQLRSHDNASWNRAYDQLWGVSWRSARRKLPLDSDEQLEDLISQVIGKEVVPQIINPTQNAFSEVTDFEDVLNLASRIVSNRAIDEIRRRVRRPDSQDLSKTPELALVSTDSPGVVHEEIQAALCQLDARYRDVIDDFYFEGLSTAEIAEKRGRPKGSICSDLLKARQLLGRSLADVLNQTPVQL